MKIRKKLIASAMIVAMMMGTATTAPRRSVAAEFKRLVVAGG
ncbi:MAG: hypothetical protein ACLR8P_03450 [Clostridium fessum]